MLKILLSLALFASAEGMHSTAFRRPVVTSSISASTVAASLPTTVKPGVVTGKALFDLLEHAKANKYAIPAINVVSTSAISACLEAAKINKSPVIIQFSRGGGQFIAGKAADNKNDAAAIAGCVAAALHVRTVAALYGVPVILHTDHCMKSWLGWFDGLLDANEAYFKAHGEPLFSSHMLDLSEEPLEENIAICKKYLERMAKSNLLLEVELGVTGGEEDGVDNTEIDNSLLYTQPSEVYEVYKALGSVPNGMFTVAAAFGNVHGVYAPGNVKLTPEILHNSQKFIKEQTGSKSDKPVFFVFHGGSGSSTEDIRYAIEAGVIKMNIDTDTQWSYWDGIRSYEAEFHPYLQGQIGNPESPIKPNKKYYDPRMPMRRAEEFTAKRLSEAMDDLNSKNSVP